MVRVRHYTRVSSMRKILEEQRIVARDQNKVFVERVGSRLMSPTEVERRYRVRQGKGNAFVEFDVEEAEFGAQYNVPQKGYEPFLIGHVDLTGRAATGELNF